MLSVRRGWGLRHGRTGVQSTEMAEPLLVLEVPANQYGPRMARDAVAALDRTLGDDREDTLLLVSELVTSSVLRADAGADEPVAVAVHLADDRIRVEVSDPGGGLQSAPVTAGRVRDAHETTWGLRLVEMLAQRWGAEPQGAGALVWFEMERAPRSSGRFRRRP